MIDQLIQLDPTDRPVEAEDYSLTMLCFISAV